MQRIRILILLAVVPLVAGFSLDNAMVPQSEILSGGPPKDGIPALTNPPLVLPREDEASYLRDGDRVIGLVLEGEPIAVPLSILWWHEIVNLKVGDLEMAVSHCPLTGSSLAFDRGGVGGAEFGVTGLLYKNNLIMYDRQTETWWQQASGLGIVGEQMGTQLEFVPSQIISLDEFEATYPDGVVLSRATGFDRDYGRNPYPGYDRADEPPFLFSGTADGRIAPKERVATTGVGDQAIAFASDHRIARVEGLRVLGVVGDPALELLSRHDRIHCDTEAGKTNLR